MPGTHIGQRSIDFCPTDWATTLPKIPHIRRREVCKLISGSWITICIVNSNIDWLWKNMFGMEDKSQCKESDKVTGSWHLGRKRKTGKDKEVQHVVKLCRPRYTLLSPHLHQQHTGSIWLWFKILLCQLTWGIIATRRNCNEDGMLRCHNLQPLPVRCKTTHILM